MKTLITSILLVTSLFSSDLYQKFDKEWENLKPYQKTTAQNIFKHAKKDNLAWTATAMAWQESQFGRWQVSSNNGTWDCGMFQNNTKSVAKREKIPDNAYNRKELCTDLITDFNFSYLQFAAEISFWERVHKGNWRKIWASYNGGWKGNKEYAQQIAIRIQILKKKFSIIEFK